MKQCPQCQLTYPNDSLYCFVDGIALVTPRDPRIGSTIAGRYVLESELGVGGMATVYRARHKLIDRPCAIKILVGHFAQDPVLRERFVREARHAQRIAHQNVIEIYDQGETEDGAPFLVMELLEGKTLAAIIGRGPMPLARVLPICIEMTRGIARAHDFEVIHRDLKPENVFILPGDAVKLLDFGIARCAQDARLTNLGEIFGTPQYMAPERGTSIDSGPAADLYAFGIMVFEMLTGRLPFDADDPATWLVKQLKEVPPHLRHFVPSAPEALDRLVFDLMAKDPAERPMDAHRVQAILVIIARSLDIPIPAVRLQESSPLSVSPPSSASDPWQRRVDLFDRMVAVMRASPDSSVPRPLQGATLGSEGGLKLIPGSLASELTRTLQRLKVCLRDLNGVRDEAYEEQQLLERIEHEGRDMRLRIGAAMDELTVDVSKRRVEAKDKRARVAPLASRTASFRAPVKAAHKDLLVWEGRSAFVEPSRELAGAYRKLADLTDAWYGARHAELVAESEASADERAIQDVDYQIRSLRESLGKLEKANDDRRQASLRALADVDARAQHIESELVQLATDFCAPLRARSDLTPLFVDLEREGPTPTLRQRVG